MKNSKNIFAISLSALMAVTAANADIVSTSLLDEQLDESIGTGTLTFTRDGESVATFGANQNTEVTVDLTVTDVKDYQLSNSVQQTLAAANAALPVATFTGFEEEYEQFKIDNNAALASKANQADLAALQGTVQLKVDAATLDNYSTTTQMNTAIGTATADMLTKTEANGLYATAAQGELAASAVQPSTLNTRLSAYTMTADLGDLATLDTVGAAQIADGAVTNKKLGTKAVQAANIADNTITATQIANGAVGTTQLSSGVNASLGKADTAIQQAGLTTALVPYAKTADLGDLATLDTVGAAQIADGAVTNKKLGTKAVQAANIADNTITATQIAEGAIGTAQLSSGVNASLGKADTAIQKSGTITAGNLISLNASGQLVDSGKMGALASLNTVSAAQIANGAVGTDQLAAAVKETLGQVETNTGNISTLTDAVGSADGTCDPDNPSLYCGLMAKADSSDLGTLAYKSSVATAELAANAVTAAKIADNTITATQIANNTISAGKLDTDVNKTLTQVGTNKTNIAKLDVSVATLNTTIGIGTTTCDPEAPSIQCQIQALESATVPVGTSSLVGGIKSGGDITISSAGGVTVNSAAKADAATSIPIGSASGTTYANIWLAE